MPKTDLISSIAGALMLRDAERQLEEELAKAEAEARPYREVREYYEREDLRELFSHLWLIAFKEECKINDPGRHWEDAVHIQWDRSGRAEVVELVEYFTGKPYPHRHRRWRAPDMRLTGHMRLALYG